MKKKGFLLKFLLLLVLSFHLALFLATIIPVSRLKGNNPSYTSIMLHRHDGVLTDLPSPAFLSFRDIPLNLTRCLVHIEDSRFYQHKGFDLQSILFALRINRREKTIVYGGSTISQQLARTLFLTPRRDYLRKYFELILAVELEMMLDKDRILELYMNYAEWGPDVYGIADGSFHHFGRSISELNPEESLKLLTLLPNPLLFTPENCLENPSLRRRYASLQRFYRIIKDQPPVFISTIEEL